MFQRFEIAKALVLILAFSVISPSFAVNPDHLGKIFPSRAEIEKPCHSCCENLAEFLSDIRLNQSLFTSNIKKVSYGTTIQIDGLKDWTHGNVVDLAFAAHAKFVKQFNKDTLSGSPDAIRFLSRGKDRPLVTTTLV